MRRHRPRLGCRSRSLRVRTATPSAGPQQCRAGWRRRSQAPVSCRGRSRCQPRGGRRESVVAGGVGPAFLAARVERQQRLTSRGEYPIIAAEDCLVHRSGSFPTPPRTPVAGVERVHPIQAADVHRAAVDDRGHPDDPPPPPGSVRRQRSSPPPSRASTVPASPDSGLARRERTLDPRPRPGRSGHPRS